MKVESLYEQATLFIEKILHQAKEEKINLQSHFIDHICYRVETTQKYAKVKEYLKSRPDQFKLLIEAPINGRLISTFKMSQPFEYIDFKIPLLELPEPKIGSPYKEGFEHLEFVMNPCTSFQKLMKLNSHIKFNTSAISKNRNPDISVQLPDGKIKFHENSLEDIISEELREALNL